MNDGELSRRKLLLELTPVLGFSLLAIGAGVGLAKHDERSPTGSMSAMLTDGSHAQADESWAADAVLPSHVAPRKPVHHPAKRKPRHRAEPPAPPQVHQHPHAPAHVEQHPSRSERTLLFSGSARRRIVSNAAAFYGVPYVWGGESPRGFDCSGLTQWVFREVGLYLPRTSQDQGRYTYRVGSPKMGDLVFFGSPAYHVGIYDSSGYMIAAPHTGSVVKRQKIWSSSAYFGRHPKLA